jgi:hypothetical protein
MARGIITAKPSIGSTGAASPGKIIVTDGGAGTSSAGALAAALPIGSIVDYFKPTTEKEADLVDFTMDPTGQAVITSVAKTGKVISSLDGTLDVNSGEIVLVVGNVDGRVTVNSGTVVMTDKAKIGGKVSSTTANSYIFADGSSISAKVEVTGAGYLSLQGVTIDGKVSSDGTVFTSVTNCIVNGNLDVINAGTCSCSGNTVDGKTNTPNCK